MTDPRPINQTGAGKSASVEAQVTFARVHTPSGEDYWDLEILVLGTMRVTLRLSAVEFSHFMGGRLQHLPVEYSGGGQWQIG